MNAPLRSCLSPPHKVSLLAILLGSGVNYAKSSCIHVPVVNYRVCHVFIRPFNSVEISRHKKGTDHVTDTSKAGGMCCMFERYDVSERQPKMLPCAHTLCLSCAGRLFQGSLIRCPECRREHAIQGGVPCIYHLIPPWLDLWST